VTEGILNQTAYAKANGSGSASARLGPLSAREVWRPETATVGLIPGSAAPTNEATCVISFGDLQTKRPLDSCIDGSSGDSTGRVSSVTPKVGQYIWADWTGGDAGVTFQLTVTGKLDV
jgi:hypothetical protein